MIQKMVSLTDQNQISIPMWIVKEWGDDKPIKFVVTKVGEEVRLRPVRNFWSLAGSLKGKVSLTDKQLSEARSNFGTQWSEET